jgi:hypothetical protein
MIHINTGVKILIQGVFKSLLQHQPSTEITKLSSTTTGTHRTIASRSQEIMKSQEEQTIRFEQQVMNPGYIP